MNVRDKRAYLGNISQVFDVKDYRYIGGRADGVRATDITTSGGLSVSVLADRAMDFASIRYRGVNMGFVTPVGVSTPNRYESDAFGFLRNFEAGFLTTCGLTTMGNPSEDNGELLGIHGRISNTPAEEYAVSTGTEHGIPYAELSGKMRQVRFMGENLLWTRRIRIDDAATVISFTDTVENDSFFESPFMVLYHFNLGYPFLSPATQIYLPSLRVQERTPYAKQGLEGWSHADEPSDSVEEMCFYHQMQKNADGRVGYAAYNEELGIGCCIEYDGNELGWFVEWKCMQSGNYVMGLEPANACLEGRVEARKNGSLSILKPFEKRSLPFRIEFFEGKECLLELCSKYSLHQ